MTPEWVPKAEDLSLGYRRHALFRDLSFDVARGEILGIVGPNGCGKTTLLRTMLGLLEPLGGRVQRQSGLHISYVPQRERIERIIPVTAFEVVLMGPGARTQMLQRIGRAEREAANRSLALLGIESLSRKLFRNIGRISRTCQKACSFPNPQSAERALSRVIRGVAANLAAVVRGCGHDNAGNVTFPGTCRSSALTSHFHEREPQRGKVNG